MLLRVYLWYAAYMVHYVSLVTVLPLSSTDVKGHSHGLHSEHWRLRHHRVGSETTYRRMRWLELSLFSIRIGRTKCRRTIGIDDAAEAASRHGRR